MSFFANLFKIPFIKAENEYLRTENERLRAERDKYLDKLLRFSTGEGLTQTLPEQEPTEKKQTYPEWVAMMEKESLEKFEQRMLDEAEAVSKRAQQMAAMQEAQAIADTAQANPEGVN